MVTNMILSEICSALKLSLPLEAERYAEQRDHSGDETGRDEYNQEKSYFIRLKYL
jgi:hypothetical protein